MYTKKKQFNCPNCGSMDIAEDQLMKCNCTKGMGKNLCYPKFICRECETKFGDKKNDKSKDTVKVTYTLHLSTEKMMTYIFEEKGSGLSEKNKTDSKPKLTVTENGQVVKEKLLTKRLWKKFLTDIFNIFILEWPINSNGFGGKNLETLPFPYWTIEVLLRDGNSVLLNGSKNSHPYYNDFASICDKIVSE